jgi:hypothetical protein
MDSEYEQDTGNFEDKDEIQYSETDVYIVAWAIGASPERFV